jgi:crotonobetaine/carnitine-CoA ligase
MTGIENAHVHPFAGIDVAWLVRHQAQARGEHPFLVWAPFEGEGRSWTYAAFADHVERLAAGLAGRGIGAGDRVLVHLDNCPETVLAWYACARLGAVCVTTNSRSSGEELAFFADHSGAVAAITQPGLAELVNANCGEVRWLAVTGHDGGAAPPPGHAPGSADSFTALEADPALLPERAPDPAAPVGIQYTSGTTSRPKGVLWTHANALWGAKVNAQHEDLRADDVHLTYLPLFHTNAQSYSVLAALWVGASVVIQPRFSASRFWPASLAHRCTWTSMVPFCLRALLKHEVPREHHYRLWGNAISEPETDAFFRVKTIGWWGMTETITHGIVGDAFHRNRPNSIGRAAPEYGIAVVHDDGTPAGPGETAALKIRGVRGLSLFAEYLDDPQATAASFDEAGFFATGDLVTVHEDGFISFADRAKDMLKVGGENVAASEIERVIMEVPGVREVAVVAKPDSMLDEVPAAFVLADETAEVAALRDSVLAACRRRLADFKLPREVRLIEAMPRSTLEKIAKAELRRMLREEAKGG